MTDPIDSPAPLATHGADPLNGRFSTPGDAAIAQRALLVAALCVGQSRIEGLPETADVLAIMGALRQMGVHIEKRDDTWLVRGLGPGGLLEPKGALDFVDASDGAQLALGLLAPNAFSARVAGGATLARHSIAPLIAALGQTGATVTDAKDGRIPLTWRGNGDAVPMRAELDAPSELIKSALLLAAVQIGGIHTLHERVATRDHTEKLLAAFGAEITVTHDESGGATTRLVGHRELRPCQVRIPGDPSAAVYPIVAALIVPGSDLVVGDVLVNPLRTGLIDTLLEMGGDIQFINQREIGGEHIADLRVRSSRMKGVKVDAVHAAAMLDDIAPLAIAAAFAHGETRIEGLAALRQLDSDPLAAIAAGLAACKVTVAEGDDDISITGNGRVDGAGSIVTRNDPRVAMSFLVMGLAARQKVSVDDARSVDASFPGLVAAIRAIGGKFVPMKGQQK